MTEHEALMGRWPRAKAFELRGLIDKMNLCGCGSSAEMECVLELLVEAETHTDKGFYRDKWFEFGAKVLDGFGLLEHGTAIGFAWLTDEGKLLLEFLRDFGTDDDNYPEWVSEFSWTVTEDADDWYANWKTDFPTKH